MRQKFLLGSTKENTLVFAEVEVKTWNGFREFTASFDEVSPVRINEDILQDRAEDYVEGLDSGTKWNVCERFDCKPSEIAGIILGNDGIEGIMDISLYPESYRLDDGDEVYFESSAGGQHDTRDILNNPVVPEFSKLLHRLWDNYHLKEIPEDQEQLFISQLETYLLCFDERTWIQNWLNGLNEEGDI